VGSLAACDQGEQHVQPTWGPTINLVAANVGPKQSLPADGTIQLAFDRLLLPATAVRQSFILVDADQNALEPLVTYDPVTRVVSLSNPNTGGGSWLNPGQPYSVYLGVAKYGDDESGVRAIDGAPLSASSAGFLGFLVSAPTGAVVGDAKTNFCSDVMPIFSARCSLAQCHGSPTTFTINANTNPALLEAFPDGTTQPAAGLILDTSLGVTATAIGRVAQGANTGPYAHSDSQGSHFGLDMPIIDPGNPSNSWLMYKLLLAVPQPDALEADAGGTPTNPSCQTPPSVQPAPLTQYELLSDNERAILGNYVLGQLMPYPKDPATPTDDASLKLNLTMAELERVRAWIAAGAVVTDCSTCTQ
jgi:hypothetical protein